MRKNAFITWFLLSFGVCGPFLAAMALEIQNYQGVSFVTGGIGVTERERLTAMAADFSLQLKFAMKAGNYLGAVQVRIQDGQGNTVLEGVSDGPWFMVDLRPGSYTVQASYDNENLQKTAQIQQGRPTELLFRFQSG